jgi:hypothetical protein
MTAHRIGMATALLGLCAAVGPAQQPVAPSIAQPVAPAPPTALFGGPALPTSPTGIAPPSGVVAPAVDTLTGQPPPGTVYSPWTTGRDGPVTYEGYFRTGVSIVAGGGAITDVIKTGWNVQTGARTLFFNPSGDAAWALDLGIGYTRNDGRRERQPVTAFTEGDYPTADNGQPDISRPRLPDVLTTVQVLGFNRSSLNFAVGRDYFLNGPGVVGQEAGRNVRFGWDVGGRWGSTSLGYRPVDDPTGFRRRQDVYHGLFLGSQLSWERPMGAWTLFVGGRVEWSYYWMNILPPQDSNFRDVNLLGILGLRF